LARRDLDRGGHRFQSDLDDVRVGVLVGRLGEFHVRIPSVGLEASRLRLSRNGGHHY
jgi:hypothetical protein